MGKSPKLGEVVSVMDLSALEAAAGADDAAPSTDGQRATYFSVSSLALSALVGKWKCWADPSFLPSFPSSSHRVNKIPSEFNLKVKKRFFV